MIKSKECPINRRWKENDSPALVNLSIHSSWPTVLLMSPCLKITADPSLSEVKNRGARIAYTYMYFPSSGAETFECRVGIVASEDNQMRRFSFRLLLHIFGKRITVRNSPLFLNKWKDLISEENPRLHSWLFSSGISAWAWWHERTNSDWLKATS